MTNLEKYNEIFKSTLNVSEQELNEKLVYQEVPEWDSVGHMNLISALEDEFDIMFDTDDIIDFSSYAKGMDILKSKYDVTIK